MTLLYLIRHGECLSNLSDKFAGQTDYELTETGKLQAELLSKYFVDVNVDCIYSSDLSRAYDTIIPTAKVKELKINNSKNLRKIDGGEWEQEDYDVIAKKYSEEFFVWRHDLENAVCPGGESVEELGNRFFKEIYRIINENENKSIIVATHALAIRTFFPKVNKKNITEIKWVSNASVSSFEYKDNIFCPIEIGYDDFLGDLTTTLGNNI